MSTVYPAVKKAPLTGHSKGAPGFPGQPPVKPFRPVTKMPASLAAPANDALEILARRAPAWRSATALFRVAPWLGLALTAYELWELYRNQPGGGLAFYPNGWTKVNECLSPVPQKPGGTFKRSKGWIAICTSGQAMAAVDNWNSPIEVPPTLTQIAKNAEQITPFNRWQQIEHWQRPAGQISGNNPMTSPAPVVRGQTAAPLPQLDPGLAPIGQPIVWLPIPFTAVPYMPDYIPGIRLAGDGLTLGRVEVIQYSPGLDPGTGRPIEPVVHPGRAGRRTKERKARVTPAVSFVLRQINRVTETIDFVDAAYDALPYNIRRSCGLNATPQKKASCVYRHADQIDISSFIENLVRNEIEDRVIGSVARRAGIAARDLDLLFGFQVGPAL